MPVLTRNMRKKADLPDLPTHFPVDVPIVRAQPRASKSVRPTRALSAVPRSSLEIVSPVILSSPTRLDAPLPLTPSASRDSFSSQQSRASSYSIASTPTQYDPPLTEVHPGVRKLHRIHPDGKWNLEEHYDSVRLQCPPNPFPSHLAAPRPIRAGKPALFNREWSCLSEQTSRTGYETASRNVSRAGSESVSSEATMHGSPSVSSKSSTFSGSPERAPRFSRRQAGLGVSKQ
ncbi:hypothetical protein K438DRAFT_931507 [Mycena galopus ATCC 62051]|nr:hypothetical protein K438DRAFT_931507 [Mycena galopus ATCC 62051]